MKAHEASFRHSPKQVRARRRVELILKTAEAMFTAKGVENVTTNDIAAKADIPIGSLYQFFASKDEILEAVAGRYLDQADKLLAKAYEDTSSLPIDDAIRSILTLSVKMQLRRPNFLRFLGLTRPQALTEMMAALQEKRIENTIALLRRADQQSDPDALRLKAELMVAATGAMIPQATRAKTKPRQRIIDEITRMLVLYIED